MQSHLAASPLLSGFCCGGWSSLGVIILLMLWVCNTASLCTRHLMPDLAAEVPVAVQARKRSLGNIRFIGFLFVQKLLSEKIMHTCIQQLLQNVRPCHAAVTAIGAAWLRHCISLMHGHNCCCQTGTLVHEHTCCHDKPFVSKSSHCRSWQSIQV